VNALTVMSHLPTLKAAEFKAVSRVNALLLLVIVKALAAFAPVPAGTDVFF